MAMDEETFNALLISLRREVFRVELKIKNFSPNDVCLNLKDEISARLEKIDELSESCQEKIYEAILSLNENIPSDLEKINTLRKLSDDINIKVRNNSKEVKLKLDDLIKNKPLSAAEKRSSDEKVSKLEAKLTNCSSRAKVLLEKVNAHKEVDLMTEQEVRHGMER